MDQGRRHDSLKEKLGEGMNAGELTFADDYMLVVRELLTTEGGVLVVQRYSYEGWRNTEILFLIDEIVQTLSGK
jgi:hypothetical protein